MALVHGQLALDGQETRARDGEPVRARGQGQIAAKARNTVDGDVGVRLVDIQLDVSAHHGGLGGVEEALSSPLLNDSNIDGARGVLTLFGLSGLEKRYPHQLSGGQRQR